MYSSPEEFGGRNQLISIPVEDVDLLPAEHQDPALFRFGSEAEVLVYNDLYHSAGSPRLVSTNGWAIFRRLVNLHIQCLHVV